MKIIEHFALKKFPFIITALLGISLLIYQEYSIRSVHHQADAIAAKIKAHEKSADLAVNPTISEPKFKSLANVSFDLKKLNASFFGELTRLDKAQLREEISSMTPAQLMAVLDEVEASDLSDGDKSRVWSSLFWSLADQDTKSAMTYMGIYHRYGAMYQAPLIEYLKKWAETSPSEASSWLDGWSSQQPDYRKKLNRVDDHRVIFESAIVPALLKFDPHLAIKRILDLTPEEARQVMSKISHQHDISPGTYANFARQCLQEKDSNQLIASQVIQAAKSDGLARATEVLAEMNPTPAERDASLLQTSKQLISQAQFKKKISIEDIDTLRDWAQEQDISDLDQLTGQAVAKATGSEFMQPDEVIDLLKHYYQPGNDHLLVGFLEAGGCRCQADVASIAQEIDDPHLREKWVNHIKLNHSN
ncbi:hypothetical protein JIN85_09695 [Luteolibacter pohnpeiensis]|uniref:Uncharacterized protein n=1 Tax=Luteolibacter pohnpeiensis TaxID=454153 RepID=A0A934S7G1_9BACT|nr:hypothetical protein [Luteolibacter pohnpeiensis]MBK1882690.1 hypothetical protein [Luteolibacter pohnpeiensis]